MPNLPRIKSRINKYQVNQIIFLSNLVVFGINIWCIFLDKNWLLWSGQFVISVISLHYFCNLVHLASHQMLSKNRTINHIIGWISALPVLVFSFVDFKITHTQHHLHTTNPDLDPDHKITVSGPVWLLPFRIIIYKDGFFLSEATSKHKWSSIVEYTIQRAFQLSFFVWVILNSNTFVGSRLAIFWILPLLIVGVLNAMFLYFYPHYQNNIELWSRQILEDLTKSKHQINNKFTNILNKTLSKSIATIIVWSIDLSRTIHQAHHDKVLANSPYYPEFWLWNNKFFGKTDNLRYLSKNL